MNTPSAKSIVISSRTNSNNLAYLHQFVHCCEYKIDALTYDDIETVFLARVKKVNSKN